MAESILRFKVDAKGAIQKINQVTSAAGRLGKSALGASSRLGGLAGIVGRLALVETGRRMAGVAASFQQTELRLKLLTKEYGEFDKANKFAAKAAKTFGLGSSEAIASVTDIYARLRPIGVELKDIESTFVGFNTAAKLSGVSAGAASGAFLQLAQALGSGRLQGDEFRSIAEQLPKLNQVIAKEMDVPIGQLKKLASEGKVTAEVVIKALKRIEKEGGPAIAEIMAKDPTQQMKNLRNATEDLSRSIGEILLPAQLLLTKAMTGAIKWLDDLPDAMKLASVGVLGVAAGFVTLAPLIVAAINHFRVLRIILIRKVIPALHLTRAAAGPIAIAIGLVTTAAILYGNSLVAQKRAQEEFNELLEGQDTAAIKAAVSIKELALAEAQLTLQRLENANKLGQGINPERAFGGSATVTSENINTNPTKKLIEALTADIEKLNQRLTEIPGELAAEEIQKANAAMQALGKTTAQTSEQFKTAFATKFQSYLKTVNDFGGQVGNVVVKAFKGMEDSLVSFVETGKFKFKELATSIISDMIRIAIRQAIIAPFTAGFGGFLSKTFGGPRAEGGSVAGGSSYLVGERGPEMFTPKRSGSIAPNSSMGGNISINVNVDASGSEVEGDDDQANQLGSMLGAAIQQELVSQKRPGGLLAALP